ncbi:unnamed protein product [Gadus morhua 'NCC']
MEAPGSGAGGGVGSIGPEGPPLWRLQAVVLVEDWHGRKVRGKKAVMSPGSGRAPTALAGLCSRAGGRLWPQAGANAGRRVAAALWVTFRPCTALWPHGQERGSP